MVKVYCYPKCTTCKKALKWLDDNGIEYKLIDDRCADVYGKPNITQLRKALMPAGCDILTISEHDESLESFFISLVGGGNS